MIKDRRIKIVIIGAGSLEFSSRLTADLLSYPELASAHFALVDVDRERLEFAGQIVARIFEEGDYSSATWSLYENRKDALIDADFVISSILVGGYDAIEKEIDIPMKYGLSQAIGDTLTPGGIMRCLRTLPVQIAIARDIVDISPDAFLLNYTNPMSMLCLGMFKAVPSIKLVGLCHSVQGTTHQWAHRLGVDMAEVTFECAGINHQAWITKFDCEGKDLLPRIRELAEEPRIWRKDSTRLEYIKHFGYPVTESSGHNSEYSPWFRKNEAMIDRYCPGGGWNGAPGFIKELYNRPDWRETMQKMVNWETPVDLERSLEYGAQIVNAIVTDKEQIIYGNVMNSQQAGLLIDNLPADACVEVPCLINDTGINPMPVGELPEHLAAINRNQINVQQLAVSASLHEDPEKVFQAMCMDPLTASVLTLDEIREMTRELLAAHQQYLPDSLGRNQLESRPMMYLQ